MWFLMVRREPVGPLTKDEVLERIRRGEVGARTHAWKEGFDEWERLGNLPEFKEFTGEPGTETSRSGKRRGTLPLPQLANVARESSERPPADPAAAPDGDPPAELEGQEGVDPAAVTTRWDPSQVATAIAQSGRKHAEVAEQPPVTAPTPAVVAQAPLAEPPPEPLDADLAELFGSKPRIQKLPSSETPSAPREPAPSRPAVVVQELQPAPRPAIEVVEAPGPAVEVVQAPGPAIEVVQAPPPPSASDTPREQQQPAEVAEEAKSTHIGYISAETAEHLPVSGELDQPAALEIPADPGAALVESEIEPEPAPPPEDEPDGEASLSEMASLAVAPPAPEPVMDAADFDRVLDNKLIGERSEDSVLFSRSQLNQLVHHIDTGEWPTQGDSLMDIKPLAPETGESLPGIAPLPGAAAMPIMMPTAEPSGKRGLGVVLLVSFFGILLALAALGGVLYLVQPNLVKTLLGSDQAPAAAADRQTPAAAVASAEPRPATPVAAAAPAPETAAQDHPSETSTPGKARPRKRPRARGKRGASSPEPAPGPAVAAAPRPAPAPARPRPAPAPARKAASGDELDRLIDQATGGGSQPKPAAPAPARPIKAPPPEISNLPGSLDRDQVITGMKRAAIGVQDCRPKMDRGDAVTIQVTIDGRTGRITRSKAVSKYAGTPAGECVAISAQFAARFPKFSGPPITLKYPFIVK